MGMIILIEIFFLTQVDNRTRGHEVTLVKDQCKVDISTHSHKGQSMNETNYLQIV